MNRILLAALLAFGPLAACASETGTTYVLETRTINGKMYIDLDESLPGTPGCATSNSWDLVTRSETLIAAINAAQESSPSVQISGDGTCTGNVENLRDIAIGNISL